MKTIGMAADHAGVALKEILKKWLETQGYRITDFGTHSVESMDYPDVAGVGAPKPMLVFAGAKDELFPVDSARDAFRKMEAIWKAYGAQEKFRHVVWEERGHEFAPEQQRDAFDWLDQHFGNR